MLGFDSRELMLNALTTELGRFGFRREMEVFDRIVTVSRPAAQVIINGHIVQQHNPQAQLKCRIEMMGAGVLSDESQSEEIEAVLFQVIAIGSDKEGIMNELEAIVYNSSELVSLAKKLFKIE